MAYPLKSQGSHGTSGIFSFVFVSSSNGTITMIGKSWSSWRTSSWTDQRMFLFSVQKRTFSLAGNKVPWQSIDGWCRKMHFPRATFSHALSLHIAHSTNHLFTLAQVKDHVCRKVSHPRIMDHFAPHLTRNTCTSSLSPTSPVLLSSSTPNPDLLPPTPFAHCKDARQDGSFSEHHSSTS